MKINAEVLNHSEKIKHFLLKELNAGQIKNYQVNISYSLSKSTQLTNGIHFTRDPLHTSHKVTIGVFFSTGNNKSGILNTKGTDFEKWVRLYLKSRAIAQELPFAGKFQKFSGYPVLELASPELLSLFETNNTESEISRLMGIIDNAAKQVKSPRLMNREISVLFAMQNRIYFDSNLNEAFEFSASCELFCSFSLQDSIESSADIFGTVPTIAECLRLVSMAARNIVVVDIRPFEPSLSYSILLSPTALLTLVEDLIIPNLSLRDMLDGTSAWELNQLGKKVIENISISDNPHLKYSPFSSAFDTEGTPTQKVLILDEGVLKHPLMNVRLLEEINSILPEQGSQLRLSGHGQEGDEVEHTNVFIDLHIPRCTNAELIEKSFEVLHINQLTGMSCDALTGQFALDAEGVKVYQDGKLKYSTSVTLRGNLFDCISAENNLKGDVERVQNYWLPSLFTSTLKCVSKNLP